MCPSKHELCVLSNMKLETSSETYPYLRGKHNGAEGHKYLSVVKLLQASVHSKFQTGANREILLQFFPHFQIQYILNLNFYIKVDPGSTYMSNIWQNRVELCTNLRVCHQAKFSGLVAKSEIDKDFLTTFLIFWHLCWSWVRVNIEMGNLKAKSPCVWRMSKFKGK